MLKGARPGHEDNTPFSTMLWRMLPAVRLLSLADPKKLALPNSLSLYQQYPRAHPCPVSRTLIPAASISQLPAQVNVGGLRARSFTSTSSNSIRRPRSASNRPFLGIAGGHSARRGGAASHFLSFRASGPMGAFITAFVGVSTSESRDHERVELE